MAAGIGLALGAALTWLFGAALRRRRAGLRSGLDPGLSDGVVLLAEAGIVTAASPDAGERLGGVIGKSLCEVIGATLAAGNLSAASALARLVEAGEPLHLVACDRSGGRVELAGAPQGGMIRLILRDAGSAVPATGGAEALAGRPDPAAATAAMEERLTALPLAIWRRQEGGALDWSVGGLRSGSGAPMAGAAAMAAAEHPGQGPGREGGQRFRLELPGRPAEETFVVDALEMPDRHGGRIGFATDASAALEAERTLDRVVHTMTETFAHLTAGLAIFDRNQALTMFNPALLQMWQVDAGWLARRPSLGEVLGALRAKRRIPETADFHAWRRRLTDLFKNTDAVDYEELWHLADGSNILVLARPHPHGALAFVFDDVTERLRLEQRYRHSIDLRRATLDRLEEGLAVFGPDGLLQLVNTAFHEIWGTDAETVRPSMHAGELLPMIRGLTVETEVWARLMTFVTGEAARQAWAARLTLGSGRILGARFSALPDGSTMAVFGDVTDSERIAQALRERNEALETAQEMRAAMLDQISHRLRNPLNTIFGFGQLIGDSRFGTLTDLQRGYAESILESARHLLASIDEVTDLAGLELGRIGDANDEVPLCDTLMLTGQLLEKRATDEGVALRVSRCDVEAIPAVEAGRLRQIVFSMMTGAIGRCRAGGAVEMGARPGPGGTVEIFSPAKPFPAAGMRNRFGKAPRPRCCRSSAAWRCATALVSRFRSSKARDSSARCAGSMRPERLHDAARRFDPLTSVAVSRPRKSR